MTGGARRNPLTATAYGGRTLSALQLPFFLLLPPSGYGVLTVTGRRSGKRRRRCLRAVRRGNEVYVVAIKGLGVTGWAKNALASPEVRIRIRGGNFSGRARRLRGPELAGARDAYCESIHAFDYLTWANWQRGRPSVAKLRDLLCTWFDDGTPLVVELIH